MPAEAEQQQHLSGGKGKLPGDGPVGEGGGGHGLSWRAQAQQAFLPQERRLKTNSSSIRSDRPDAADAPKVI